MLLSLLNLTITPNRAATLAGLNQMLKLGEIMFQKGMSML